MSFLSIQNKKEPFTLLKNFQGEGSASAAGAERLPLRGDPSLAACWGAVRYTFPGRARVLRGAGLEAGTPGRERRRRQRGGSPRARVPCRPDATIPSDAAQLSAPAGPPRLSLPRACQLGPNLISVLSVRTPLKPNSAYYQQLSYHTRLLPPRREAVMSGAPCAGPMETVPRTRSVPAAPAPCPGPGRAQAQLPRRVTGLFLRKQ